MTFYLLCRAKEVEDNTPVPERVWAMRNVARTLSMGSSLAQAKALIEKAIRLQEEFLQSEVSNFTLLFQLVRQHCKSGIR